MLTNIQIKKKGKRKRDKKFFLSHSLIYINSAKHKRLPEKDSVPATTAQQYNDVSAAAVLGTRNKKKLTMTTMRLMNHEIFLSYDQR